ncbi:TPA: hypothetical protein NV714_001995 [Escherichia coli]|nr:hypothetical protein [Escherichia coli]
MLYKLYEKYKTHKNIDKFFVDLQEKSISINQPDLSENKYYRGNLLTCKNLIIRAIEDGDILFTKRLLKEKIEINNSYFYNDDDDKRTVYANNIITALFQQENWSAFEKINLFTELLNNGLKTHPILYSPTDKPLYINNPIDIDGLLRKGAFNVLYIVNKLCEEVNNDELLIKLLNKNMSIEMESHADKFFSNLIEETHSIYYSKKIYRDLFPNVALTKQEELKYINNLEKIERLLNNGLNPYVNKRTNHGKIPLYFFVNEEIKNKIKQSKKFDIEKMFIEFLNSAKNFPDQEIISIINNEHLTEYNLKNIIEKINPQNESYKSIINALLEKNILKDLIEPIKIKDNVKRL